MAVNSKVFWITRITSVRDLWHAASGVQYHFSLNHGATVLAGQRLSFINLLGVWPQCSYHSSFIWCFLSLLTELKPLKQQSSSVSLSSCALNVRVFHGLWRLSGAWMAKGLNGLHAGDGEFRKRTIGKLISRFRSQGSRVDSWLCKSSRGWIPNETIFAKVSLSQILNVYLKTWLSLVSS